MADQLSDAEKLQRLKDERVATDAAKWADNAARRKALSIRTSSFGAGMCLVVGLFSGSSLLLLVPGALLFAGGACWLSVRFGLGNMLSGLVLGIVATLVVFLSGGGSILTPLFTLPLGAAIFIGHRGDAEMSL